MTSTHPFADSDTPSLYVAGTLPIAEAEAFEEHYFSCAQCWEEVRTGTAVRSILRTGKAKRQTTRPKKWWMTLAAAAVIGVVTIVVMRDRVMRDTPDVLRGDTERTITIVVERAAAQLQIRWPAVARATRYETDLRSAEGEVLQQKPSTATTVVLDGVSEEEVYVRVMAYDAQGEEIARSPLVRAPSR